MAIAYWLLAFVLAVLGGVVGSRVGSDWAPEFSDDGADAATSGTRLLMGVLGFVVGAMAVTALFAGVWLVAWVLERRRAGVEPEDDSTHGLELLDEADESDSQDVVDPDQDEAGWGDEQDPRPRR